MGHTTAIEWTDATYNPWVGCTKISPGCKHCYMMTEQARRKIDPELVRRTSDATFRSPLKRWGAKGGPNGERAGTYKWADGTRVFTCSYSDWNHTTADPWRREAWDLVRIRPGLVFQILSKRWDLGLSRLPDDWGSGWANVHVGASVEDAKYLRKRAPDLAKIPAALRFLSIEPLLDCIDTHELFEILIDARIGWVIVGGESEGAGQTYARHCDPRWIANIVEACELASVPCFVKQLGSAWAREELGMPGAPNAPGDRKGGHDLERWPDALRVRQLPKLLSATP